MVLVKADENTEAGVMPSEQQLADMQKYNEELVKAGVILAGEGLHPIRGGRGSGSRANSAPWSTGPSTRRRSWLPASGCGR
jgi:hypothetical protein